MTSNHNRVLSGMRPTGRLHLGHYHGVLKNWVRLQHEFDCYFMVADWHALTTHYENPGIIGESVFDVVVDWLAAGINPGSAKIFVQSHVLEHAELHVLLSMITPLGWLERVPSYKDQQEKLKDRDLATYGFLGYPLLQSADILIYRADKVPVGEDQVPHIELTREVARRFNFLYGREAGYEAKAEEAIKRMGKKQSKLFMELRKRFQEQGEQAALEEARALLETQANLSMADRERLHGYVEGTGRTILPEPQPLLTAASKMPGLDGQKMSKSYNNTISLREDAEDVSKKIRVMPTDPARVRRTDPGDPERCPVWQMHKVYSNSEVQAWVQQGCKSAGIGCLDCKQPVIDSINKELEPMRQRAQEYSANRPLVEKIIAEGADAAHQVARETLIDVRQAMGLGYRRS
jgi:tryptophanyl-tRNA synthetase